MKIFIAWEFGNHFGHILRQRQIALEMRSRGHEILLAVKDVTLAQRALGEDDFAYVQAPALPFGLRRHNQEVSNYADILAAGGFAVKGLLQALVDAWQTLFRLYQPDVVLLDYSPAALFAARLSELPFVMMGTGFEVPPVLSPFPCFRPGANLSTARLLKNEESILKIINEICVEQSRPVFESLADCVTSGDAVLLTFAEFDHYPDRKQARYLGPLFSMDMGAEASWTNKRAKKIFVYIRPNPELIPILECLRSMDADVICVVTNIHPDVQARFQTPEFQIFNAPVKLASLIEDCDLVVAHNGHGLLSACALCGIPVLGIPTQIEQLLLADCVTQTGIGLNVSLSEVKGKLIPALHDLLGNAAFRERSAALAWRYRSYDQAQVLRTIAEQIEDVACQ